MKKKDTRTSQVKAESKREMIPQPWLNLFQKNSLTQSPSISTGVRGGQGCPSLSAPLRRSHLYYERGPIELIWRQRPANCLLLAQHTVLTRARGLQEADLEEQGRGCWAGARLRVSVLVQAHPFKNGRRSVVGRANEPRLTL